MIKTYLILKKLFHKNIAINIILLSRKNFYYEICAKYDLLSLLDFLKENNAYHKNAAFWAAKNGFLRIIKFLSGNHRFTAANLHTAAKYGHFEIVNFIYDNNSTLPLNRAFCGAASNGHFNIVNYLIQKGAEINFSFSYAIRRAIEKKHYEIAGLLLLKGSYFNDFCIMETAKSEILFILFETLADINRIRPYISVIAVKATKLGNLDLLKYLVLKYKFMLGDNLVYFAAKNGYLKIVKFLHENKFDLYYKNNQALYVAKKHKHFEIYEYISASQ